MMKIIKPGSNGMPPIKDQYEKHEKALIVEAAEKFGVRQVADIYKMKWQSIVSWKKYYSKESDVSVKKSEKKTEKKTPDEVKVKVKKTKLVIQSAMGGEITPEEILNKIGDADTVYVRVDENKAYWVKEQESGSVNLW